VPAWPSGTLHTLRTGANPLRIPGLNPLQRLAFLEGILHWLNVLPQLVLVLMPLSLGVLGVAPLRVSGAGLLTMALPLVLAQLLLARWFSAHSRTALMPELYRWVVLLPLAWAVLTTLLGRTQPFRVTPKALPSGRVGAVEKRLLLPLLGLLSLQVVAVLNLVPLLRGTARFSLAPVSASTLAVGLGPAQCTAAAGQPALLPRPAAAQRHPLAGHAPVGAAQRPGGPAERHQRGGPGAAAGGPSGGPAGLGARTCPAAAQPGRTELAGAGCRALRLPPGLRVGPAG
jgi:hypothetical protein